MPTVIQLAATAIFGLAVLHTFSTKAFEHLAHVRPNHAGLWHLLGEVEAVFGFWAIVLLILVAFLGGVQSSMEYLQSRNFTEAAFIFVIMVIAASRPVLDFAAVLLERAARLLPLRRSLGTYVTILTLGPILGSFITEPAAMTLSALLLRERYFADDMPRLLKYSTIGVLFVNVSIGGTLTPYAAPPVLMVAEGWGWDIGFMMQHFGWKAVLACTINAAAAGFLNRTSLARLAEPLDAARLETPRTVVAVHLGFIALVVVASHHPLVFIGAFLLFLGFTEAYRQYQSPLILREGLMVAFFLAGLVVLGGLQDWWLQPLILGLGPTALYFGATALTAITDNAALTYLGSLVEGMSNEAKYALVAGAVTGGGLTVIANAPNPAGMAILKGAFDEGAVSPLWLALAATPPTLVAIVVFWLLPG